MIPDPLDGLTPEMEEWIAANPPPPLSAEQAQLAATMFRAGLDAEQTERRAS